MFLCYLVVVFAPQAALLLCVLSVLGNIKKIILFYIIILWVGCIITHAARKVAWLTSEHLDLGKVLDLLPRVVPPTEDVDLAARGRVVGASLPHVVQVTFDPELTLVRPAAVHLHVQQPVVVAVAEKTENNFKSNQTKSIKKESTL